MKRRFASLMALAALGLGSTQASATEEVIVAYDAKSAGMGLTGTAWLGNAAAAYHNVANLGAVKRFDAVLGLAPNISRVKAPYLRLSAGAATPAVLAARSQAALTPLGFAGVAWRPHHLVAVGLASGISQISGVSYRNVPLSLLVPNEQGLAVPGSGVATAFSLLWDTRLSVAINPTSWLSIGGGWRMGFAHQQATFNEGGNKLLNDTFNGQRYDGAIAGITVRPHRQVRIGASYRSKLNISTAGTAASPAGTEHISGGSIFEPHHLTAGVAVQLVGNRLLLAGDYKHWFYKDAVKHEAAANKDSFRDAMSGHVGVEWLALPILPLRAGFVVGRSKVADAGAFATRMPPGMLFGGTLGAGVRLPTVDLDLAFGYGGMNSTLGAPPAPLAGKYGLDLWLLQISANVHI